MRARRGVTLVLVLLLGTLILILGMSLMASQSHLYSQADVVSQARQARLLAEAGLEDALLKLERDPSFPPPLAPDQTRFTYAETLPTFSGQIFGSYEVTVDTARRGPPYSLIRIISVGRLGGEKAPRAERTLMLDLDLSAEDRSAPGLENPRLMQPIELYDSGEL